MFNNCFFLHAKSVINFSYLDLINIYFLRCYQKKKKKTVNNYLTHL